mmetsp:Transcript_13866/g.26436  ORF Transcript_13866/g.26436 Transcript_13866/m.26436 type:complete len:240 (+) Transcript_13866:160-879(+)
MLQINRTKLIALAAFFALQSTSVLGFSSPRKISSSSRCNSGCLALRTASSTVQSDITTETNTKDTVAANDLATKLLATCAEYGQIGSKLTENQRSTVDDLASSLSSYSDPAPAQIDLRGTHELIYSAAPGGSSGALGPLVGKVSQTFLDDVRFINRVELFGGIVKIELYAERKVLDESRIRVKFKETVFSLFGNEVKRGDVKGSGVWNYKFSGLVNVDGEKMLLRVMETPSTFVIVQRD